MMNNIIRYLFVCMGAFLSLSNPIFAQHVGNSRHVPVNPPAQKQTEDMGNYQQERTLDKGNYPSPPLPTYQPDPVQARAMNYNNSELLLDVNILLNAKADYQVAIFSLREERASLVACQDSMQKRINDFTKRLVGIGILPAHIYVDVITQIPIYGYDLKVRQGSYQTDEIPIGFELKKNVHIRYEDEKFGNLIMDAAAQAGIYDLAKVDYVVTDLEQINTQLRAKANELLRKRIDSYKELGINVLGLIGLQNEIIMQYYPNDRYASYSAFNNNSLNAFKNMQGASEKLMDGIKQSNAQKHTTYFYDKIPFTRYDAILNPDVLSPVVQFVYQIQVRYRVKPN